MGVTRYAYAVDGWGVGEVWSEEDRLVAHDFTYGARASGRNGRPGVLAASLAERTAAFLAGEPVDFGDVSLELGWCTPFQRDLATALRAVSRGEVVTYGELAALAGRPRAARAAGTFCATNRFAFVVPCHRVVAAGGLGGYGSAGPAVKRRLLALEGAAHVALR